MTTMGSVGMVTTELRARSPPRGIGRVRCPHSCVEVQTLALGPEDGDGLHRAVDGAEPVGRPGGELHGLAGLDPKVLLAQ